MSPVYEIFEDRDGNIWLATNDGVQRYDGHNWITYTTADGLGAAWVTDVSQTPDGAIWVGTYAGISRFDGTGWTSYTESDGLPGLRLDFGALHTTRDGAIWAGFSTGFNDAAVGAVGRFDGESWSRVEIPGVPNPLVDYIYQTSDGAVWIGLWEEGIIRYDGSVWTHYTSEVGLAVNGVSDILETRDGDLWFAHHWKGVSRFDGSTWRTYRGLPVRTLWQTDDGRLWGVGGSELHLFDEEEWRTYQDLPVRLTNAKGRRTAGDRIWIWDRARTKAYLFNYKDHTWTVYKDVPSDQVSEDFAVDNLFVIDDEVWLGGSDGALHLTDNAWVKYTAEDGLIDGPISTVLKSRDGFLWVAGQHQGRSGAARYEGGTWRIFSEADGLVGLNIAAGAAALDGSVWFGTKWRSDDLDPTTSTPLLDADSGGGVMQFDGRRWTVYTSNDGLAHNRIYDIGQSPDGTIWAATLVGLSEFDGSNWVSHLPYPESTDYLRQKVRTVSTTKSIWISQAAPLRDGIARFDGATWARFSTQDGLPSMSVWEIHETQSGSVWAGTDTGLGRLDPLSNDKQRWVAYTDENAPVTREMRSIKETSTGELWMRESRRGGRSKVVHHVPDPDPPETHLTPAPERVSSEGSIHLEWSGTDLWDKTPTNAIRYQWRMDDGTWSPTSRIPAAAFTDLAPGAYRFEVRAIDFDGNVDDTPASHAFIVEAPWWRNPVVAGPGFLVIVFALFQSARVVQAKRKLQESVQALSSANNELFQVNRDLETANFELQRDRAVERIRAEVQSMDRAEDFERVLSLLTTDLSEVGLSFDSCEIDALDEPVKSPTMAVFETNGFKYTTYTLDPEGHVSSETFSVSAPFPGVVRETVERFIAGEPWFGTSQGKAIVEVPAGGYGRLRLNDTGRDSFTEDEVATLREFADAVALGYARYLDIREIQQQTERKSAFLASMSHELRTPMNAIKGFTNLVLRRIGQEIPDQQRENLEKVDQASDHLLAMINDLLDLSKIEAGRMDVNPERFDVAKLIKSCCDTVSPLVQEGVELKQEIADDIGEANTDKARLQQMVINLLSNAIKFTDSGSVTVTAERVSGRGENGGESLAISVSDTGKGIPDAELPTLFDEYRQVEGSESSVQKGTGLGLSITKKFAELLGGTISVESEVGRGSSFTVSVPVNYRA